MQKSLKEEIKYLEAKIDKNPASILFARLADVYLQSDRLEDAIGLCEKGIKKYPYYVTGHYILGKCYLKKKLFDQAEKELKRVLLFDPKYIAAHRDYGELMAQIGWNNTCEMSYEEILRIDPFNEKARLRLEELREQLALSPEPQREDEEEMEFDEVEENILTGVSNSLDEPESESDLNDEARVGLEEFADSDELFQEFDEHEQDEKANLDLLEDIFSDEKNDDIDLKNENIPVMEDDDVPPEFPKEKLELTAPEFRDESAKQPEEQFEKIDSAEDRISDDRSESPKDTFDSMDDSDIYAMMDDDSPHFEKSTETKDDSPFSEHEIDEDFRELNEDEVNAIMSDEPFEDEESDSENMFQMFPDKSNGEERETSEKDNLSQDRKKEKIVTPTLGEIYAAQHQYSKAIGVYEILRKKDPDNEMYLKKIEYLQQKLEESQTE